MPEATESSGERISQLTQEMVGLMSNGTVDIQQLRQDRSNQDVDREGWRRVSTPGFIWNQADQAEHYRGRIIALVRYSEARHVLMSGYTPSRDNDANPWVLFDYTNEGYYWLNRNRGENCAILDIVVMMLELRDQTHLLNIAVPERPRWGAGNWPVNPIYGPKLMRFCLETISNYYRTSIPINTEIENASIYML